MNSNSFQIDSLHLLMIDQQILVFSSVVLSLVQAGLAQLLSQLSSISPLADCLVCGGVWSGWFGWVVGRSRGQGLS